MTKVYIVLSDDNYPVIVGVYSALEDANNNAERLVKRFDSKFVVEEHIVQ